MPEKFPVLMFICHYVLWIVGLAVWSTYVTSTPERPFNEQSLGLSIAYFIPFGCCCTTMPTILSVLVQCGIVAGIKKLRRRKG